VLIILHLIIVSVEFQFEKLVLKRQKKVEINFIFVKEGRGGRSYEKIGFYDLDLASVAGSGDESKACLLHGYQQTNSSPANAYLQIRMKLTILEGDHIFRRFVLTNFFN
jgi:hypothetical protein